MKKKLIMIIILIVITLSIIGLIYAGTTLHKEEKEENNHLVEISFKELQEKIDNKDSFILLLSQTTCSHCAEYRPVLKKVLKNYNIYAYEIATDKLDKEQTAKLKDIANASGTPTTVFIENGEEKNTGNRLVGAASESKLISRLKAVGYIKE